MSETELGCFGKPSFSVLRTLQTRLGVADVLWLDAAPVFSGSNLVVSIDAVQLSRGDIATAVELAVMHSINDIFAANARPISVSISLTLEGRPEYDSLLKITDSISHVSNSAALRIGKLHTSFNAKDNVCTVCAVGRIRESSKEVLTDGAVYLIGQMSLPADRLAAWSKDSARTFVSMRNNCIDMIKGLKKDVSGDGLAGAVYQVAAAREYTVELDVACIAGEFENPPLDSCQQDRNYADYAEKLEGFLSFNNSRVRAALFEPQFAGPLLCFSAAAIDEVLELTSGRFRKIGVFYGDVAKVSLK